MSAPCAIERHEGGALRPASSSSVAEAAEQPIGDEEADRQEGDELDHRLIAIASIRPSWCSVASIWRVPKAMAKAASDERDEEGEVAEDRARACVDGSSAPRMVAERGRDRLELQRDVGHGADDRDDR